MTNFDPITGSDIVIVDRPQGQTSHDAVGKLRRAFRTRKVGHPGTLDPMATDVLVPGVGRGTRSLPYVHADTKSYHAVIRLSAATLTDDVEGKSLSESSAALMTDGMTREKATDLTGIIMQKPAAVSVVKIDGVRAYERICRGKKVNIPARPVIVIRYEVLDIHHDSNTSCPGECIDIDVEIDCSAGTLIRALIRNLGDALRIGGYLTALQRTTADVFTIGGTLTIDGLTAKAEQFDTVDPEIVKARRPISDHVTFLLPMGLDEACLRCFDTHEITEQRTADLVRDKWLELIRKPGAYATASPTGKVLALLTESGRRARTIFVVRPATL